MNVYMVLSYLSRHVLDVVLLFSTFFYFVLLCSTSVVDSSRVVLRCMMYSVV